MSSTCHPELYFPPNFMWGAATAAYQIEGGVTLGGRSPSIWDRFCSEPSKVYKGHSGAVACDHYTRWREDIELIEKLGTGYYRFSIAWGRILPAGRRGTVNEEGVAFYKRLIEGLKGRGVEPVVTLYHWDLPVAVEDTVGGWAGPGSVVDEFETYARVCFARFGALVKWWITINEPWCCAVLGYETGEHAPGKTDRQGVDVYRAGHNLLLAHARAVKVYRREFQQKFGGKIGIALNSDWAEGIELAGVKGAERDMSFSLGWFADPVYFGDYPALMKETCGDRLPKFTNEEKKDLKGSSDFFALNHYSSHMVVGVEEQETYEGKERSYRADKGVQTFDLPEWKRTDMGWAVVPWGFRKLLVFIHEKYKPKGGIIITENGVASAEPDEKAMEKDTLRIEYIVAYLRQIQLAIAEGADVRGYFLWSLLDNFEWAHGYSKRFGIVYVNYNTQRRVPKPAFRVYSDIVRRNSLPSELPSRPTDDSMSEYMNVKKMTSTL